MIAATPFLWLVVRDTFMLLRASDDDRKEEAQWILAERLAQTIGYSEIRSDARAPMWSTISFNRYCFTIDASTFRPSDTPAVQSSGKSWRWGEVSDIFQKHKMLAEYEASRISQHQLLSKNFSTSELVLFNACLSATPFARRCEAQISDRLKDKYYKNYREVVTSLGLVLPLASDPHLPCFTMPRVIRP